MKKLFDTSKMPYEVWLQKRNQGIGGSEIGAILALNKWCSPIEIWARKTDPLYSYDDTEQTYWGRKLEEPIGLEFPIRMKQKGEDYEVERFEWIIAHDDYDYLTGNIDFRITSKTHGYGVLECKNVSSDSYQQWDKGDLPEYYITQLQWYMGLMGYEYGFFAALIGGKEWRCYKLEADPQLFELMVEKALQFWDMHIINNEPPDLIGVPSEVEFMYGVVDKYANFDDPEVADEVEEHCITYKEMNELKKFFTKLVDKEKNIIKIAVGKGNKAMANEWKISNVKKFNVTAPKHYIGKKYSAKDAENYVIRNLINTREVVEYEFERTPEDI